MAKKKHNKPQKTTQQSTKNTPTPSTPPPAPKAEKGSFVKDNPFISSLVINGLLFLVAYMVYTPFFLTNDDPAMMLEVAGVALSPEPTEYMLFTSVVLGTILKNLYTAMPSVSWYGFYLAFSLFLGNTAILYAVLRRNPHIFAIILYVFYFVMVAMYNLIALQFTVVGFVCGFGGMALVFLIPHEPDNLFSIKGLLTIPSVIGAFLVGLSLMIRIEAVGLAIVLFSPILLAELYNQKKLFIPKLLQFGLVIAVCVPLYIINNISYSTPEWKEANAFRAGVAQFVDNHVMHKASEEKRKLAMEKVGWQPIDNAMLSFWFFMDEKLYSAENFETVLSILENEMNTDEIDKYIMDVIFEQPIVNRAMILAVFLTVFLFVKTEDKLSLGLNIGLVALSYIGVYALLWILHYLYKQAPPHVYISAYIFLATLPLLLMTEKTAFNPLNMKFDVRVVVAGAFGLLVLYNMMGAHQELKPLSKDAGKKSRQLKQVVKAMNPNENNLFVVWASSFPYENISPFEDIDYMRKLNLFSLGSIQRTPIAKATLNKFGITDLYTAILENPNVYLIVRQDYQQQYNWLGLYNQYMYTHYQKQISNPDEVLKKAFQAGSILVLDVK